MKRIAMAVGCILSLSAVSYGAQPVFDSRRDSSYVISHSSIAVSSVTVTPGGEPESLKFAATSGYRDVRITLFPTAAQLGAGASVFYKLDGSTAGIYDSGYIIRPSSAAGLGTPSHEFTIESSGIIYLRVPNGSEPIAAQSIEKKLPQ
jgi:hypothetical protein